MAAIFQTTFSNAFSWMKMYEFRLKFHWILFLRFELTIFQHWFMMAWRRPGDKLLFEPMSVSLLAHICVTRTQQVNAKCFTYKMQWYAKCAGINSKVHKVSPLYRSGFAKYCFVMVICYAYIDVISFLICFEVISLALGESWDWHRDSEVILTDMDWLDP